MILKREILGFVCLALLSGCGKGPGTSSTTQPDSNGVITHGPAPAMHHPQVAADVTPINSLLMIGDQQVSFAPAKMRLSEVDGKVVARVYSDEPAGNLVGREAANSYDFEMPLTATDKTNISGATWTSVGGSIEKQDTPHGILLPAQQKLLQPMNVTAKFHQDDKGTRVSIDGTFCSFSTEEQAPGSAGTIVRVMGVLQPTAAAEK